MEGGFSPGRALMMRSAYGIAGPSLALVLDWGLATSASAELLTHKDLPVDIVGRDRPDRDRYMPRMLRRCRLYLMHRYIVALRLAQHGLLCRLVQVERMYPTV